MNFIQKKIQINKFNDLIIFIQIETTKTLHQKTND